MVKVRLIYKDEEGMTRQEDTALSSLPIKGDELNISLKDKPHQYIVTDVQNDYVAINKTYTAIINLEKQ